MTSRQRFLAALDCRPLDRPPLWIMRQAGRYLPEYRALKTRHPFTQLVRTPELAAEVTLQPLRRFPLDAAILFSDILTIPEALGQPYHFPETGGIQMQFPLNPAEIDALAPADAVPEKLDYTYQTLRSLRNELPATALLGFAGTPWTLACYMLEGKSSQTFPAAQNLLRQNPRQLHQLLQKLTDSVLHHLRQQAAAGADALQLFDTHGGLLQTPDDYETASLRYIRQIAAALEKEKIPLILYSKNTHAYHARQAAANIRALSIDHTENLKTLRDKLPPHIALQGNLAPELLTTTPRQVAAAATQLLTDMRGTRGHILNLGHGITPDAKLECVETLVQTNLAWKN